MLHIGQRGDFDLVVHGRMPFIGWSEGCFTLQLDRGTLFRMHSLDWCLRLEFCVA